MRIPPSCRWRLKKQVREPAFSDCIALRGLIVLLVTDLTMWPDSVKQLVQTLHKDTPSYCFSAIYLNIPACCRHRMGATPPHCPLRCIVKQAEFQDRPPPFCGLLSLFSRKTTRNGFPAMQDRPDSGPARAPMTVRTSSYMPRRHPVGDLVTVCACHQNVTGASPPFSRHATLRARNGRQ